MKITKDMQEIVNKIEKMPFIEKIAGAIAAIEDLNTNSNEKTEQLALFLFQHTATHYESIAILSGLNLAKECFGMDANNLISQFKKLSDNEDYYNYLLERGRELCEKNFGTLDSQLERYKQRRTQNESSN